MVQHFKGRNSPLKCVDQFPSITKHCQRFLKYGWNHVYVKTIQEIWNRFVGNNEIAKLESVEEPFDETAELMLKCLHYVLIIGLKDMEIDLDEFWTKTISQDIISKQPIYKISLKINSSSDPKLFRTFQR